MFNESLRSNPVSDQQTIDDHIRNSVFPHLKAVSSGGVGDESIVFGSDAAKDGAHEHHHGAGGEEEGRRRLLGAVK